MQRFLAQSPWVGDTVIGRLQEYLGPRLEHPEAVWVLDVSDFPKQGVKSVGVARQYCGRLGKVANCQAGDVSGLRQPAGPGPGGQAAVPAGELDLCWTFRISSGVSKRIYKSVVQSDREFLNVGVGGRR